jgi:hypothetical protein
MYHNAESGRVVTRNLQFHNQTDLDISDVFLINKTLVVVLNGYKMVFVDFIDGKQNSSEIEFEGRQNFIYLKNGDILGYQPKRLWYDNMPKYWLLSEIRLYKKRNGQTPD